MQQRIPIIGIAFCAILLIAIGLSGCNPATHWALYTPNNDIYEITFAYEGEQCVGWTLIVGDTTTTGSNCEDAISKIPTGSAVLPGSGIFSSRFQNPIKKTVSAGADTLLLSDAFTGVDAFNLATGVKLATIPLQGNPLDLVPLPGQSTLYAVVYPANGASPSVAVIDAAQLTLTATIALPANTFSICGAISPDGSTLYVSNAGSSSLSANPDTSILVIDTASQTVKGTIPFPASGNENLFGYYLRLAVSPDGTLLYASGSGGYLEAIDTLTQKPVSFIGLSPGLFLEASSPAPHIVFAPDGTKAYVGVGGPTGPSVVVIDPYTSQQVAAVRIGSSTSYLADIAISSNGSILYTVDESTGITYPIDTATLAVGTPIPRQTLPTGSTAPIGFAGLAVRQ
jgi:DNA-binding beta-propeller fold protein YncE